MGHLLLGLTNLTCQELFFQETEDNPELLECFDSQLPFETQGNKWLKTFNSTLFKCFKKVKVINNKKKKGENEDILCERIELKKEMKLNSITDDMRIKIEEFHKLNMK